MSKTFRPSEWYVTSCESVLLKKCPTRVLIILILTSASNQRAKKIVSNSLGLVDFALRLVIFVLNLPDRQVLFLGEIQVKEE